jgi:hypothetical protein
MVVNDYKKMVMALVPENLKGQLAKEKGDLGTGVKYWILASIVAMVVYAVVLGLQMLGFGAMMMASESDSSMMGLGMMGGAELLGGVFGLILIPIFTLIGSFIACGVMWGIAKLLGGTGDFASQYYHFAVPGGGLMIVQSVVGLVPCVGGLVGLVLWVYSFYLAYLIYQSVHKISSGKAIVLVALPVVLAIVAGVLMFLMFAAMFSALLGGMTSAGYT